MRRWIHRSLAASLAGLALAGCMSQPDNPNTLEFVGKEPQPIGSSSSSPTGGGGGPADSGSQASDATADAGAPADAAATGDSSMGADEAADAQVDAESVDAAATPDSATSADSGTPDTGTADTGTADTGTRDTGTPDSGAADSGRPDADSGTAPTWNSEFEGVFMSYCSNCHGSEWATCSDVQGDDQVVEQEIASGDMPRGETLPASVKAALLEWLDAGAPCQ
jgi:hypothetical protein